MGSHALQCELIGVYQPLLRRLGGIIFYWTVRVFMEEGNPLDRPIFLGLILFAIGILCSPERIVNGHLRRNHDHTTEIHGLLPLELTHRVLAESM